jgi:hypothetical protein
MHARPNSAQETILDFLSGAASRNMHCSFARPLQMRDEAPSQASAQELAHALRNAFRLVEIE